MQDNRNQTARSNVSRIKQNNNASVVKKSTNVKKTNKKAVKKVSNLHAVRTPHATTIKKKDKAPFPWSIVVTAVLFTSLFLFMMMNYAEVDKYRGEIAALDDKIATMEKNQDDLEVTLSNKYDLKEIGDYASEELGMVPGSQINNRYVISIEQGDKTEMHSYDEGEEGGFGFLLTGLGEVIKDFLN